MKGKATNAVTSGIEGAWTTEPTKFDNGFLKLLFGYEWELKKSPAVPTSGNRSTSRKKTSLSMPPILRFRHNPIMTDADMAMKMDPIYRAICEKFMEDDDYFRDTFARAWFKLTHRDMGPKVRYVGRTFPRKI